MMLPSRTLCFLVLLTAFPTLYAANPCLTGGFPQPRDGNGTGGTGRGPLQEDGSGTGGTGHTPWISGSTDGNGMGGTGHGPLQEDGTGTGGTGNAPWKEAIDGNGMGGTGNTLLKDDGGIGGTGHDTEVEGVITGFASVCVNGLELHYQPTTPIAINGRKGSTKDLAVGQVVRAQAKGMGDQLAISNLQVRHLMVAPLQDIGGGRAQVMGQTILLDEGAQIPSGLGRGQKVAISGFVGPGGIIIATRLDAVSADSPDSVTGEVSNDSQGNRTVGGVTVDAADTAIKIGENVRAEGRYANGRFQADHVERDDSSSRAERFVIQGPVKATGKDRLNVGDKRLAIDPATPVKQELPNAGAWVRVEGQRRGKELLIDKIEVQERVLPGHNESNEKPIKHPGKQTQRETGSSSEQNREYIEKAERGESAEKQETPERPEKVEAPEKAEAPERPERVEAPERPERVEAPERPEKIETPERH